MALWPLPRCRDYSMTDSFAMTTITIAITTTATTIAIAQWNSMLFVCLAPTIHRVARERQRLGKLSSSHLIRLSRRGLRLAHVAPMRADRWLASRPIHLGRVERPQQQQEQQQLRRRRRQAKQQPAKLTCQNVVQTSNEKQVEEIRIIIRRTRRRQTSRQTRSWQLRWPRRAPSDLRPTRLAGLVRAREHLGKSAIGKPRGVKSAGFAFTL